jgi:hypothetical protein
MNSTQEIDERLRSVIVKRRDPFSTQVLESRMRSTQCDSEREQVALLLDVEHGQRAFIVSEASFLANYGFCAVDALTLAVRRWHRHGWKGIHSEEARVMAVRARYAAQGLPV